MPGWRVGSPRPSLSRTLVAAGCRSSTAPVAATANVEQIPAVVTEGNDYEAIHRVEVIPV